jgi:phosphoribosyl 1,2-cyclic phosphate phosphodiesterase
MNCYASPETVESMHRIFPYISCKANPQGLFRPMVEFIPVTESFTIGDVRLTPFKVPHGPETYGYMLESGGVKVGYVSDCSSLPDAAVEMLSGADLMVLDCLRKREHPTHLSLDQSLEYMDRIGAKHGLLVHMCHDISHEDYLKELARSGEGAPASVGGGGSAVPAGRKKQPMSLKDAHKAARKLFGA